MSVRTDDVWCTLGGQAILQEINLHVTAPVTVLLGLNGAGKTTLFRVLAGLVQPSRGAVIYDAPGRRAGSHGDYSVGYLPQSPRTVRGLKVRQYLEYFAFLKRMSSADAHHQIDEIMTLIGLDEHATKATSKLSGGMMRRLAIGAALLGSPDIILLDEPTAGLDPEQRLRMRELIREVAGRVPVLLSTHLAEDTAHLADEIIVLHQGRVVANHTVDRTDGNGASPVEIERFFLSAIGVGV